MSWLTFGFILIFYYQNYNFPLQPRISLQEWIVLYKCLPPACLVNIGQDDHQPVTQVPLNVTLTFSRPKTFQDQDLSFQDRGQDQVHARVKRLLAFQGICARLKLLNPLPVSVKKKKVELKERSILLQHNLGSLRRL